LRLTDASDVAEGSRTAWVDAFNRADVDALAALYHADATNHQVAESPIHGRDAIRAMFRAGFDTAVMI